MERSRRSARSTAPVFVLGGHQTDFARNWTREGGTLTDMMRETALGALAATRIDASAVDVGHVSNFVAELLHGQSHLGGLLVEADPGFNGMPTSRHEAACAAGAAAVLAAMADIESGRYDLALVTGIELMRNVPAFEAQKRLGSAAYVPRETEGVEYPWPTLFSRIGDAYEQRYGLDPAHLAALARSDFDNARRNPNAQTRKWTFGPEGYTQGSTENPVIAGRIHRQDCSQVTDGGAAVLLASAAYAETYARREGTTLDALPRITGWGHHTGRMALDDKLRESAREPYMFPAIRQTVEDAYVRAGIPGPEALDAIECHDCFTTTYYMLIDHLGITPPGEARRAIEEGWLGFNGRLPVNPSGGLIGLGHPVGATGVRMVLDAAKQVTDSAGGYQVTGAKRVATLSMGGSGTTAVAFVVERGAIR